MEKTRTPARHFFMDILNDWRRDPRRLLREYLLCVVGAVLVGLGVYFFKFPNHFSTGGVSGVSVVLSGYFHWTSTSWLMTAINLVMLVLGFAFVGGDCGIKTVIGTLTLSGTLLVLEKVCPLSQPLTDQPLLELIFAVSLPAVGSAILFNVDGNTGGTDILALILKRYTSMNIGVALFCSDVIITLLSFVFGVKTGLYSLLGLLCKSVLVDSVIENINQCKCFQMITEHPAEISDYVQKTLHRSTTLLSAVGGYSHEGRTLVIAIMNRRQAVLLRRFLRDHYPSTFLIVTNSSEVIGKGFRGLN